MTSLLPRLPLLNRGTEERAHIGVVHFAHRVEKFAIDFNRHRAVQRWAYMDTACRVLRCHCEFVLQERLNRSGDVDFRNRLRDRALTTLRLDGWAVWHLELG